MRTILFTSLVLALLIGVAPMTEANGEETFVLQGVEAFIGVELGDKRFGTTFIGKVKKVINEDMHEVGCFTVVLDFKGIDDIEVCTGTNDVTKLTLKMLFTSGDHAGNRLVLRMTDRSGDADVFWDYSAAECPIGGIGCDCPPPYEDEPPQCTGEESLLAKVGSGEGLELKPTWGTSRAFFTVTKAYLTGWLCHQYALVPRVSGEVRVIR